jgi:TRAP-type C4-dicarboxylate transport system permease large subunit
MILVITIGGGFFGQFIEVAGFSKGLYNFLTSLPYSQYMVVAIIAIIYLILGFFLDGITILVVSVPLLAPIMQSFGYDLIWIGVWVTILIEIGTITPPVAVNLFVVAGSVEDATLGECIRGVIPFYIPLLILLALITAFPILIHWLAGLI